MTHVVAFGGCFVVVHGLLMLIGKRVCFGAAQQCFEIVGIEFQRRVTIGNGAFVIALQQTRVSVIGLSLVRLCLFLTISSFAAALLA